MNANTNLSGDSFSENSERRHAVGPPPQWQVDLESLEDLGDGLVRVLWRILRDVWLWSGANEEERGSILGGMTPDLLESWGDAREQVPELADAFGTFGMLRVAPRLVEPRQLADACARVVSWADARGLLRTATAFAEAGATADTDSAVAANLAGAACRHAMLVSRASAWYFRAHRLATRHRQKREAIRALLGYGELMYGLGRYTEARRFYLRAARAAARTRRSQQAAVAFHDLMLMCTEAGAGEEALEHGSKALRIYPAYHRRLPAFGHDWAFLLTTRAHFSAAYEVLDLTMPLISRKADRALAWSALARAAAGSGYDARARAAETAALEIIGSYPEHAAGTLVNLAEAARSLNLWERGAELARLAIQRAIERQDRGPERLARTLVEQLAHREVSPVDTPQPAALEALTRHLASRLSKWKARGS
jgi:tetratricopeptide (TPR) repeat protein